MVMEIILFVYNCITISVGFKYDSPWYFVSSLIVFPGLPIDPTSYFLKITERTENECKYAYWRWEK